MHPGAPVAVRPMCAPASMLQSRDLFQGSRPPVGGVTTLPPDLGGPAVSASRGPTCLELAWALRKCENLEG